MKVYLASPFFNDRERAVKAQVKGHLASLFDVDLYDPQNPAVDSSGWEVPNSAWGRRIFNKDIEAIEKCDVVVAIDWGLYGDCGTAWEIGYAWAKDKHLLVVVPDEVLASKHSLMVANGCDNFISVSRFLANKDLNFVLDGNEQRYFLYGVEQQ